MKWLKVDGHMVAHPAVFAAGDAALGLWLRMGCWLANFPKQGDFIPVYVAKTAGKPSQIRALVESGLWDEVEGGYRQHRRMNIAGSGLLGDFWEAAEENRSRRAIPREVRIEVYLRDGHACVSCGATEDLTLDHIWPYSLGGEDTPENLQTLCRPCNSRKGARV